MTAFHSVNPGHSSSDENRFAGRESPSPSSPPPANSFSSDHPQTPIDAAFYQAAVLHAGIPVVPLDATGCILAWNAAAVRMFGRAEAEVLGRSLEAILPPDARPAAWEAFQRTIQQRSVNTYEISLIPQGGKNPLHVGVTLSCVIDPAGHLQGVAAWMRNITPRKELESQLTRTTHMASVGTLAAGVAHHFNNIACGMGTMVEFALATEDRGAMLKALRMSVEACTRIRYITSSLLACSGEATSEAELDLSDLTEEILGFADAVEPTLNQKGIALELDLRANRVTAVPRIKFGQLLQHLLRNAEDAIEDRSNNVIGAARRITVRTQSQGDQLMMEFSDSGSGMQADDLPLVFEPFFTTKGVQGGGSRNNPGLGLTLVRSIILALGGHIWADSTPLQGTSIHILVPINA